MNENQQDVMTVMINDHRYDPEEMTVPVNSQIRFKNDDQETHSVTSSADGFDLELDPGESESIDFPNAGTFDYYCRYHPEMKGMIVVEESQIKEKTKTEDEEEISEN